ncbi:MAG: DNA-binding response regulator, partial [Thermovibrio sp.]
MVDVLLVEDDEVIGELVKERLEEKGFSVSWVLDGTEAFRKLKEKKYDVVILDLMIPGIEGMELCK